MSEVIRLPRTPGLTQRCRVMNTPNNPTKNKEKTKLKNELVYIWMKQGGSLNGLQLNVEQLRTYIGDTRRRTVLQRINVASRMIQTTMGDVEGTINKLQQIVINDSLATRALIDKQLGIMLASQGDTYKPYISGEVNKTLKLRLDSDANVMGVLKALQPTGPNIQINNTNEAKTNNNQISITNTKAIDMMDEKFGESLLERPEEVQALLSRYSSNELPNTSGYGEDVHKSRTIDITPTNHEERRELGDE